VVNFWNAAHRCRAVARGYKSKELQPLKTQRRGRSHAGARAVCESRLFNMTMSEKSFETEFFIMEIGQ
jgi:hypothetical protein